MYSLILSASAALLLSVEAGPAFAQTPCPNQSGSITVPFPTGTADGIAYDKDTCALLSGTDLKIINGTSASDPPLSATSKPAVTFDAKGFHLTANGTPFGSSISMQLVHAPSGKVTPLAVIVGGKINGIVAGTSTP